MIAFFKTIIYIPLLNLLVLIYQSVAFHDFGLSIIILTILIRLLLYPLFQRGIRHQTIMQRLQPEIQRIQNSKDHSQEKKAQALLEIYKQNKVNPFSGIFFLLLQMPVLISLYLLFLKGFSSDMLSSLYSFIPHPQQISYHFLGLIDLQKKNIIIVSLAAVLQYFQARLSMAKMSTNKAGQGMPQGMSKAMLFIGPVMTLLIFQRFPAAVGLYWVVTTIFSIIQQLIVNKQIHGLSLNNEKNT